MTNESNARHDAHDAANEVKHRAKAAGEEVKRAVAGDAMTLDERVASHAKETAHDAAAGLDAAKRDVRHAAANADRKP